MKNTKNSSNTPDLFLGIDVGKADLFCHFLGKKEAVACRFDNSEKGISNLITWLKQLAEPDLISACLEQTGHYGIDIAKALHDLQIHSLFLVNPRQIKAFGQQKLRRNKSDTADAKLIARFLKSEHADLRPWDPRPIENERITALSRYSESVVREVAKLKTKCEAARDCMLFYSLDSLDSKTKAFSFLGILRMVIKNADSFSLENKRPISGAYQSSPFVFSPFSSPSNSNTKQSS